MKNSLARVVPTSTVRSSVRVSEMRLVDELAGIFNYLLVHANTVSCTRILHTAVLLLHFYFYWCYLLVLCSFMSALIQYPGTVLRYPHIMCLHQRASDARAPHCLLSSSLNDEPMIPTTRLCYANTPKGADDDQGSEKSTSSTSLKRVVPMDHQRPPFSHRG